MKHPPRRPAGRLFAGSALPAVLLFAAALLASTGSHAQSLTVTPTATEITLSGLTPGGEAILFGVTRPGDPYVTRYEVLREVVADDDGDGTATFTPEAAGSEALPWRSIWVAVDTASGEIAWAPGTAQTEAGETVVYPVEVTSLSLGALLGSAPGLLDELELGEDWLEALVVRPQALPGPPTGGVIAWGGRIFDGGLGDDDGASNGRSRVRLSDLEPVGATAEPFERLRPRDVIVIILPEKARLLTLSLAAGDLPASAAGSTGAER